MNERREFYRINDTISLTYKVLQAANMEQQILKAKHGYSDLGDLRNALFCIDARLDTIGNQLAKEFPLISEMLTLINKKIALHERIMRFDEYDDNTFTMVREVNLSASGVAFSSETALTEGTHLKLEIVTYPEHNYIPVYARVVSCRQNQESNSSDYTIAVEFEAISERDQERLMNHVLKKQAEGLKQQREEQAKNANDAEQKLETVDPS